MAGGGCAGATGAYKTGAMTSPEHDKGTHNKSCIYVAQAFVLLPHAAADVIGKVARVATGQCTDLDLVAKNINK